MQRCSLLSLDCQVSCRYAYLFYGGLILSLIAVLCFGQVINGARRWLIFGPISVQPSELAKPVLILALTRYLTIDAQPEALPLTLRGLFIPLGLVALPCWLIMRQPDLSTAMVLVAIMSVMVLMVGIRGDYGNRASRAEYRYDAWPAPGSWPAAPTCQLWRIVAGHNFCCLGLVMNVRMRRWKLGTLSP